MDFLSLQRAWQWSCWLSGKVGHNKRANCYVCLLPWGEDHPQGQATQYMEARAPMQQQADPYYLLARQEQVTMFRLRTSHIHLNYHLYFRIHIGHTEQHHCGTCICCSPSLSTSRQEGNLARLHPSSPQALRDIQCIPTFTADIGVSIW